MLGFYMYTKDPNSGLYSFASSILPRELSPWTLETVFWVRVRVRVVSRVFMEVG